MAHSEYVGKVSAGSAGARWCDQAPVQRVLNEGAEQRAVLERRLCDEKQ